GVPPARREEASQSRSGSLRSKERDKTAQDGDGDGPVSSGALAVGVLTASGVFLILQRGLVRMVIGVVLIQHAVNLLLVLAGGSTQRGSPIAPYEQPPADPLGQAFALTAIVIGLGTTIFLLAVALRYVRTHGEEDVEEGA
ncbi:MAG: sodium:proton antiporter, partial [Actinomycetota bacterium]|nr:sodium:proton antiporter [Actinomycetota bacterium]